MKYVKKISETYYMSGRQGRSTEIFCQGQAPAQTQNAPHPKLAKHSPHVTFRNIYFFFRSVSNTFSFQSAIYVVSTVWKSKYTCNDDHKEHYIHLEPQGVWVVYI